MKTRILALLVCAVMTLVGCTKTNDGFNEIEITTTSERVPKNPGVPPCCTTTCPSISAGIESAPFVIMPIISDANSGSQGYILCDSYKFGFEYFVNDDFDANKYRGEAKFNTCPDKFEWRLFAYNGPNGPFAMPYTYAGSSFVHNNLKSEQTYRIFVTLTYGNETVDVGYEFELGDGDDCYSNNPNFSDFGEFLSIEPIVGSIIVGDDGGGTQIMLVM